MTYEQLIIAVDEVAPALSNTAYKLLWRLIATAIHRGTTEIYYSQREMATELKRSKDSIAEATWELGKHITIEPSKGNHTYCSLPPAWFPPQRTLFSQEELAPHFHNRPGNQDTSVLENRTLPSWKPGHQRPENQDGRPGNQDTSVRKTRTVVLETRTQCPENQDTSHGGAREDTRARVRSIESEASASSEIVCLIDRAWGAVEIPEELEADAALLTEWVYAYKSDLGPLREDSVYPDTQMIARLLALAPLEKINCVLRSLRERGRESGDNDAWFFTVLAQQIHGASPELTRSRMRAVKAKAPSHKRDASLFGDQLLADAGAKVRKLG